MSHRQATMGRRTFALAGVVIFLLLQLIFIASNTAANMLPRDVLDARAQEAWSSPLVERRYNFEHRIATVPVAYDNNRFICQIAQQTDYGDPLATSVRAGIVDHPADGSENAFDYFRYWHGWQLITDLCLMVGGISAIQAVVFVLLVGSVVWFTFELAHPLGPIAAVVFSLVCFVPTGLIFNFAADLTLGLSLSSVVLFSAAMIHYGRAHAHDEDRNAARRVVTLMALVAGCVYCFLDFLTIPAAVIALAVFSGTVALDRAGDTFGHRLMTIFMLTMAFGIGFACTWAAKWVLAAAIMGPQYVLENVTGEMAMWSQENGSLPFPYWPQWQQDLYNFNPHLFALVVPLYDIVNRTPLMKLTLAFTAALVAFELVRSIWAHLTHRATKRFGWGKVFTLAIPMLYIPLYLVVMSSHAAFHIPVFSSRVWSVFFAIACGLVVRHIQLLCKPATDEDVPAITRGAAV